MRVQNISPLGTGRILPGLDNLHVPIGGVIDVDDDFGCLLCEQVDVWAPADDESVNLFVRFCLWIAAVKEAEAKAAAEARAEDEAPKPSFENPALARLAELQSLDHLEAYAASVPASTVLGDQGPETVQTPPEPPAAETEAAEPSPDDPPPADSAASAQTTKPASRRREAAAAADKDGE